MKKTNAARILDRLKIPYEIRTYDVDETDLSAEAAAIKLGLPPEQVFKTLVAKTDRKEVVLACIPGSAELDLKALGAATGAKRSNLVPVKDVQALTGYIRGGVSPLGTRKPYSLFLDRTAETWETISVSAGLRGIQLLIAPQDLIRATNATPGDFTKPV
ncbi:MAG: Cys-tRNA(Pro) deacylase [bacterium]|nr:Cys-tRNA(Pro) deacylase [bacterium]